MVASSPVEGIHLGSTAPNLAVAAAVLASGNDDHPRASAGGSLRPATLAEAVLPMDPPVSCLLCGTEKSLARVPSTTNSLLELLNEENLTPDSIEGQIVLCKDCVSMIT